MNEALTFHGNDPANPSAVPPAPAGLRATTWPADQNGTAAGTADRPLTGHPAAHVPGLDEEDLRHVATQIRDEVNTRVDVYRQDGRVLDEEQRAALGEELLGSWLRAQAQAQIQRGLAPLPAAFVERLRADVRAVLSPLGVMTRYLDATLWSDVEVNGATNVICTRRGTGARQEFRSPFATDALAWEWAAEHAAKAGRRFDESTPSVRFRLPAVPTGTGTLDGLLNGRLNGLGGVRVHAIGRVTTRTHLSFRMFATGLETIADLQAAGMFGPDLAAVLTAAAATREPLGLIFSGGTGAGKTTLLRAWLNSHPDDPVLGRVVTVEDEQELHLDLARFVNLVEFEARESNVDGKGAYSMERYLSHDLRRQTPERVALGELKPDGGVMPLLLAIGQGIAQGVGTTIHAPSAGDVLTRILTYAEFGSHRLSEPTVMKTVAVSLDLVVHVARIGGRRVVASVHEYVDFRDGTVTSAELWRYDPQVGRAVRTDLEISHELTTKLTAAGLDPAVLTRDPFQARR